MIFLFTSGTDLERICCTHLKTKEIQFFSHPVLATPQCVFKSDTGTYPISMNYFFFKCNLNLTYLFMSLQNFRSDEP